MKPIYKKKLSRKEWMINILKKRNYWKFLKTTVYERRKQKNLFNNLK